jgi:hypothetical protein
MNGEMIEKLMDKHTESKPLSMYVPDGWEPLIIPGATKKVHKAHH